MSRSDILSAVAPPTVRPSQPVTLDENFGRTGKGIGDTDEHIAAYPNDYTLSAPPRAVILSIVRRVGLRSRLPGPAVIAAGGRFLARGNAAKAHEKGLIQRVVLVEFDSLDKATAVYDSPGYQAALKVLGNAAERDIRIVEALA